MTFLFIPVRAAETRGRGKIALFRRGAGKIAFPAERWKHEGGSADCFFMTMLSNRGENFCLATSSVRHRSAFREIPGYIQIHINEISLRGSRRLSRFRLRAVLISTPRRYNRSVPCAIFINNNESTFFKAVEISFITSRYAQRIFITPVLLLHFTRSVFYALHSLHRFDLQF